MKRAKKVSPAITAYPTILLLFGAMLCVAAFALTQQGYGIFVSLFVSVLITGLIAVALGKSFFPIVADENGISWRNRQGRQYTSWEDIADFYFVAPETSAGRTERTAASEVVLRDGRRFRFQIGWWIGEKTLHRLVKERAIKAVAPELPDGTRTWQVQGTRPADLPRTFDYDENQLCRERLNTSLRVGAISLTLILASIPTILLMTRRFEDWTPPLWFYVLPAIPLLACVLSGGGYIRLWWRAEKARREASARNQRNERFEVRPEGITFFTEGEARSTSWESIVGYDFALPERTQNSWLAPGPICCIRTADNRTFTFTNRLTDFPAFQAVLRRNATHAAEAQLASNDKEALGGIAARWTGGEEGKGDRVYHSRTRNLRSAQWVLWSTTLFGCFLLTVALLTPYGDPTNFLPGGVVSLLFTPLAILCTLFYWTDRIIIGKAGVTHQSVNRKRHTVAWDAIRRIEQEGDSLKLIAATGDTLLTIVPSTYAYGSEIRERIIEGMRPYQHRAAQGDVADEVPPLNIVAYTTPTTQAPPETQPVYVLHDS